MNRIFWVALLGIGCTSEAGTSVAGDAESPHDSSADASSPPESDAPAPDAGPGGPEDTPSEADTATPEPPPLRGGCAPGTRVGGFIVEEQEKYSIVDGKVNDAVVPGSVLTLEAEVTVCGGAARAECGELPVEARCTLWRRPILACTPGCTGSEICGLEGECVPFPTSVDFGVVTITGLTDDVAMSPLPPGKSYFDTDVPHPVFEPQAHIELSAEGLSLFGVGVAPLVPGEGDLILTEDADLPITWEPGEVPQAHVALDLTIDQHGTSPLSLRCAFADTGEAAVPASLISALIEAGVSGFPNARLIRRTLDSQSTPLGCVELGVGSPRGLPVRVAGFTPCKSAAQCPPGKTCNIALEQCQ